jgi:5-methylcytosine-specific restriction protein A
MADRPRKFCLSPACRHLAAEGSSFCEHHRALQREAYLKRYDQDRETTAARGYGAAWRRIREQRLAQVPCCELCGAPATVVHHLRPLREGGSNDASNLQSLCARCHLVVHPETGGSRRRRRGDRDPTARKGRGTSGGGG